MNKKLIYISGIIGIVLGIVVVIIIALSRNNKDYGDYINEYSDITDKLEESSIVQQLDLDIGNFDPNGVVEDGNNYRFVILDKSGFPHQIIFDGNSFSETEIVIDAEPQYDH